METYLFNLFTELPTLMLLLVIACILWSLGKGADILVDEAVSLSVRWGLPKMVIGATIVSLGTTLPEATVSILAAVQGNPDMALGNAVGSIIANTSLIIGLAAVVGNLPVDQKTTNRQGRVMLILGVLLFTLSLPFFSKAKGGNITQEMGLIFLMLLLVYNIFSIRWVRKPVHGHGARIVEDSSSLVFQLIKLFLGIVIIIISSRILIPLVEITAIRIGIPQGIIAATLVAFGTSLPELVTAITSVKKGHGELAVGNIIGANILNVLFVLGSSAAVSSRGLLVPNSFYKLQLPTMIIVLVLFYIFSKQKKNIINKIEGMILLVIYCFYLLVSFFLI